jgi:glycosyltransferase involved in cell wall biosynthesis
MNAVGQPLDIIHLAVPARVGGLERVVEMLAIGQARAGHRVSMVAVVYAGNPLPSVIARLTDAGIEVELVETSGRSYRAERASVRKALAARPHGVLHSHGYRADVLHLPAGRALGFATVTTLHGFTGGDIKNRVYEALQRRAVRRADRVVAVSRAIATRMAASGVRTEKLEVIQNAFLPPLTLASRAEARGKLGLDHSSWVLGYVGRLSREKGADVLLDAMARLPDREARAVFIGDGPEAESLRSRAQSLGLSHRIFWAGMVDGAGALFPAFDAFVLSSRTEGTPIALFEAMGAAVPLVVTGVGGVPDVVSPVEALIVASEAPAKLAEAISSVRQWPEAAVVRARHASDRLRVHFSVERWVEQYDRVYRSALVERGLR